jgi:hypothetical protein
VSTTTTTTAAINTPAAELLFELIDGPADPRLTWVVSNEAGSGILGTLHRFSAEQASRAPVLGHKTPAAHAAHLLFSLELATQRLLGQNPAADWDASWETSSVDADDWTRLIEQIRDASARLRQTIEIRTAEWEPLTFKGIIATVAHTAYHLGALRQLVPSPHTSG